MQYFKIESDRTTENEKLLSILLIIDISLLFNHRLRDIILQHFYARGFVNSKYVFFFLVSCKSLDSAH